MSTIYEILEDYPAVNNVTELLDSDILILPNKKKEGSFGEKQPLGLADLNKNLKVKRCAGTPNRSRAAGHAVPSLNNSVFIRNLKVSPIA